MALAGDVAGLGEAPARNGEDSVLEECCPSMETLSY